MVPALHFAESAFPLHLLFERLQRLVDVVIADENLYQDPSPVNQNPNANSPADDPPGLFVLKRRRGNSKTPRGCPSTACL